MTVSFWSLHILLDYYKSYRIKNYDGRIEDEGVFVAWVEDDGVVELGGAGTIITGRRHPGPPPASLPQQPHHG